MITDQCERSLGKVMSHSVVCSETPSLMISFSTYWLLFHYPLFNSFLYVTVYSVSIVFLPSSRRRRRFWHATLRLRSAIRRHHPPQRVATSQIFCFEERKVVLFQILLDGAEPRDAGTPGRPSCLLQSAGGGLTGFSWHLHCHPCT